MLEFLQTGKALSVLAAIGIIGFVSKLITRSLYKRLLKDSENMAMTRNKNLKILKQKLENTYRLNQNIVNTEAYLDKLMYGFRFMHFSLDTWNNLSLQMILLGLLAGGTGSFLSYWYRLDSYYIVLYASVGALMGLFLAFVDSSFNITQKQQKLETVLLEYVDNSVFVRAARENAGRDNSARDNQMVQDRERLVRENGLKDGIVQEDEAHRSVVRPLHGRNSKAEELLRTVRNMKDEDETASSLGGELSARQGTERLKGERGKTLRASERSAAKGGPDEERRRDGREKDSQMQRDIDYLKQSLDQIAASRDKSRTDKDWTKNLSSEEAKLLGEIMREYFSGS